MPDILAIVSKAIFERDARVDDALVAPGQIWPVDRYTSTNKALQPLASGGRIFLVTVRPPNEALWFVGVVEAPELVGNAWIAAKPNALPVTNITALRKTITFESGKGILQDKGTLGMSLQMPRQLASRDVSAILAAVGAPADPRVDATVAAKAKPAKPARIIGGKYEVLRELGKGGMGVVYEARHTGTGRKVAVKEIVAEALRTDALLLDRFQREARATGNIETQHVAPVLDTGNDAATGHPYLVIELLHGEDLQDRIVRFGPLSEDAALRITAQAATGLARAHAAGVVHRDIKPANLFLARRDDEVVVKILDFGVARVKEQLAAADHRLTTTGVMLGTPLYMSPEQVVGAKSVDHRADLWSLGICLYESLTGTTPHDDVETLGALIVAICSKPARSIREVAPELSDEVAAIVDKSIALDPTKRYQTADDLLVDLRALLPDGLRLDEPMLTAHLDTTWIPEP